MTHRRALIAVVAAAVVLVAGPGCANPAPSADREDVEAAMSELSLEELPDRPTVGDGINAGGPTTVPPPPPVAPPQVPDETFDGPFFATNSAQLTDEGFALCQEAAERLATRDGFVTFLGFADTRPTTRPGGNEQLSVDRAHTVANCVTGKLAALGSGPELGEVRGEGIACPRNPADPLDPVNRRVEVFVTAEQVSPTSSACAA